MVVEILFPESCNLFGDRLNAQYLRQTLPEAEFVYTAITDEPYFVKHDPDFIYMGGTSESTQRRVIEKLMPLKDRILELVDKGVVFLATGNAGEIFARKISYVAEKLEVNGLGIFDLDVKTDWFGRYNGKVLGTVDGIKVTGFRTQFSFLYGDNSKCYFAECTRGVGINKDSRLEGMRRNNLICTQMVGPLLVLNPLLCKHLLQLCGCDAQPAHWDAAMAAYEQRVKEFEDPSTKFQ